jgi:hypothetical protein
MNVTLSPFRRSFAAAATLVALLASAPLKAQSALQTPSSLPDAPEYALAQAPAQPTQPQAEPAPATASSSQSPAPSQPTAAPNADQRHQQAEQDLKKEKKQRLLGIMPQFQTFSGSSAVPLTPGQKWRLASATAIDPFYIGYAFLVGGGYGELTDSHTGYGHGPAGYFKRVGSNYADNIDGALIGNGLLPILLHQDPRYFRLGTGSFGHRFLHAALSTVVCKGDNGHRQANVSNVLGNFISGAISNAYYPADERGVGLTLENGAEVTALGAIGGQLLEFGPDINHLFHRRHKTPAATPTAAPASPTPAQP